MFDLTDVTFNIPIKYDTDDRIDNIKTVLTYLTSNFKTTIFVLETGPESKLNNIINSFSNFNVKYGFIKDCSDYFHKTKLLNILASYSKTNIIASYDSDIILPVNQYINARNQISNYKCDLCNPFNSVTYDIKKEYQNLIIKEKNINFLQPKHYICYNDTAVAQGGVVFWKNSIFKQIGMANENFISWGAEDQEQILRAIKLGAIYKRINGNIYHLEHNRTKNSNHTHEFFKNNEKEFKKIQLMSPKQLQIYVKEWSWNK